MSDVSGITGLLADLVTAPTIAKNASSRAVLRAANVVAVNMGNNIPKATGYTAASVTVDTRTTDDDNEVWAEVGPTWFVGKYLEYGTSRNAPRPYVDRSSDPKILTDAMSDVGDF